MNETEQRLMFIEIKADHYQYKCLNDEGLELDQGWRIVSVTITGAGQSDYRTFALAVLLERPRRKPKETV